MSWRGRDKPPSSIARRLRDLLRASPRLQTCPYVVHNAKGKPLNAFSRLKLAVAAAAAEVGDWRFHDFRRLRPSLSTHLQSVDVSREVISRILNHTPQGVTQTHSALYAYEDEKRAAFDNGATTVTQMAA